MSILTGEALNFKKKMGCVPSGPRFLLTILRRAGTCVAVDAPDEVPTATDAVLVEESPRRTCSHAVTADAGQCFSRASTYHRAWLGDTS